MKKILYPATLFLLSLLFTTPVIAQNITGKWKTIDDETGKARSVVEIYRGTDGKFYGKVVKIFPEPGEDPNPLCTECNKSDPRYNQPVIGMVIINGLTKKGSEYSGGKILDPENGNEYNCRIRPENGKLNLRGYLGFSWIGRTQMWLPYE